MSKSRQSSSAFTIVELLIVIVVIAILAAISIVAYNGIQSRARASAASSALTQAKKKIALWQVDNPSVSPTDLATAGIGNSGDVSYQYTAGTDGNYCITATVGTTSYRATNTANPTPGGCPGHGQGGTAPVTNLVVNPSFESNTSFWTGISATIARSSTGTMNGSYSLQIAPGGTGSDSFARYGSASSLPSGIAPGSTYTISGTIHVPTAQTGTLDTTRARGITVYSWNGATASTAGQSTVASNSTGSTRISVTFTVPSNATALEIRLYNGATNSAANYIYWDAIMLTSGSTTHSYADGNSPDWTWNGTANNSTSTGPPL